MNAPTWIECEGSNHPTHFPNAEGMCSMCGAWVPVFPDGSATRHTRLDVLAMLAPTQYEEKE